MAHAPLTVMGATVLAIGSTMLTALVSFVVASQAGSVLCKHDAYGWKLCTFEPAAADQRSLAVCVQSAVCASPALHGIPPQANAITPGLALTNCLFYLPQGKAGMSVSNALGSNVFNVLIGLGLPYFIVQAARGRPAAVRLP